MTAIGAVKVPVLAAPSASLQVEAGPSFAGLTGTF